MKILIFGGDGFCGWPTTLHLSAKGHDVVIVDDGSRREIDAELGVQPVLPIGSMKERVEAWFRIAGSRIHVEPLTLGGSLEDLVDLVATHQPDAVVHFAEQRSAPYSMKSAQHRSYTVSRNVKATHDLLVALALVRPTCHLVHLGTMGVYGYGGNPQWNIPEGYLQAQPSSQPDRARPILFPTDPGSIYHMTKSLDQLMFQFYAKNDSLRITDLHQGIVWGTQTEETRRDPALSNRFDYCGDFGTVLNRFILEALAKVPLTVHGTGGQSRAFIHIQDTVQCLDLAIRNPPNSGDAVAIRNQATEVHRVRDLAALVSERLGGEIGFMTNPRKELAENDLPLGPSSFLELGLSPTTLNSGEIEKIADEIRDHLSRVDSDKILPTSFWTL